MIAPLHATVWLLRRLGPVRASNALAALARTLGPQLAVSRVADTNLRRAMPELDGPARRRVIRGVWDNLGRVAGELPHLGALRETTSGPGWELADPREIHRIATAGGPVVFVTAHIGNWEVLPRVMTALGMQTAVIYRPLGNATMDAFIRDLRLQAAPGFELFPKGAKGGRQALAFLQRRGMLGILADQKMNDGIEARLFGLPAMTVSAPAALALRFGCPIIPARVDRIGPARFRIVTSPPLVPSGTGDRQADILALTQHINDAFEAWIRARPEAWLWLHRRWPKA